jgi:hypothetical protein
MDPPSVIGLSICLVNRSSLPIIRSSLPIIFAPHHQIFAPYYQIHRVLPIIGSIITRYIISLNT